MKNPWDEDDIEDRYLDSLISVGMAIMLVVFCAFTLGLIYELAQPWVADVISNWDEVSR